VNKLSVSLSTTINPSNAKNISKVTIIITNYMRLCVATAHCYAKAADERSFIQEAGR